MFDSTDQFVSFPHMGGGQVQEDKMLMVDKCLGMPNWTIGCLTQQISLSGFLVWVGRQVPKDKTLIVGLARGKP